MKLQWPGKDKEKGRRERATQGTSVGFKLCDLTKGPGSALGRSNDVWEPLQKRWGPGKHSG
jgi:hypothetical protein